MKKSKNNINWLFGQQLLWLAEHLATLFVCLLHEYKFFHCLCLLIVHIFSATIIFLSSLLEEKLAAVESSPRDVKICYLSEFISQLFYTKETRILSE